MYFYTALQATRNDRLKGLRVLDVSHGQADYMKFLASSFKPQAYVGYDSIRRQFTSGISNAKALGVSNNALPGSQATTMNLAQLLSRERRFDLILCIETWNKLGDQERFLHQARELLSQSDEQDQAPNVEDDQMLRRQRLVIADIFRTDEDQRMNNLLSTYFEVEDVIDISINV